MILFLVSLLSFEGIHRPENTAFAWDLHSVLFDINWSAWFMHGVAYALVFGTLFFVLWRWFGVRGVVIGLLPCAFIIADFCLRVAFFWTQHGHRPVIEHVWDADPLLRSIKSEFVRCENFYRPNEEVFGIIRALESHGYALFIASNIAPDTLRCLQTTYPDYFALFDGIISPHEANNWCDKKQPEKFFDLVKRAAGEKKIIFIDDSHTNCKNAELCGIEAICFKGDIQSLKNAFF